MIKVLAKLLVLGTVLVCAACVEPPIAGQRVSADNLRLSASSMSVPAGDPVSISWQTGGFPAYLSGVGLVDAQGTVVLKPNFTTTFSLLTDTPSLRKDLTIVVTGIKGANDEFPTQDQCSGHQQRNRTIKSLVYYLAALRNKLESEMKFTLYDFSRNNTNYFMTHLSETSAFLPPTEEGMRAQRIAFMIAVMPIQTENCPATSAASLTEHRATAKESAICVTVSVASSLQYQRLSEGIWRTNKSLDTMTNKSAAMLSAIVNAE